MKKYFIVLFAFLFLGSCAQNTADEGANSSEDSNSAVEEELNTPEEDNTPEENTPEEEPNNNTPVEVVIPAQEEPSASSVLWSCQKDGNEQSYLVNNSPDRSSESGQTLLCEISFTYQANTRQLYYAVNERDFCNKKIQELIDRDVKNGWECAQN